MKHAVDPQERRELISEFEDVGCGAQNALRRVGANEAHDVTKKFRTEEQCLDYIGAAARWPERRLLASIVE